MVADTAEQARQGLAAFVADRPAPGLFVGGEPPAARLRPAFLFSGQGAIYPHMGRELYETHPGFRKALDICADILQPLLDKPLLSVMYPDAGGEDTLQQAVYVQSALFSLQYALVAVWRSWGIEPAVVLGHSIGEYCAACIAGAFSLEDGLRLVVARARLMQTLTETGSMAAVFTDASRVERALSPYARDTAIAAINGPQHVVLSGRTSALRELLAQLAADGIETRLLSVTHAFHSPLMDPILDAFEQEAHRIDFRAPDLPFISTLTGQPLPRGALLDATYWRRHCREPVRFHAGLTCLFDRKSKLCVEIGPGAVLSNLGKRLEPSAAWLPSLRQRSHDWHVLSASLAEAYASGADIDWAGYDAPFPRNRLLLPTYPFQRKRYCNYSRQVLDTIVGACDEGKLPVFFGVEAGLSNWTPSYAANAAATFPVLAPGFLGVTGSLGGGEVLSNQLQYNDYGAAAMSRVTALYGFLCFPIRHEESVLPNGTLYTVVEQADSRDQFLLWAKRANGRYIGITPAKREQFLQFAHDVTYWTQHAAPDLRDLVSTSGKLYRFSIEFHTTLANLVTSRLGRFKTEEAASQAREALKARQGALEALKKEARTSKVDPVVLRALLEVEMQELKAFAEAAGKLSGTLDKLDSDVRNNSATLRELALLFESILADLKRSDPDLASLDTDAIIAIFRQNVDSVMTASRAELEALQVSTVPPAAGHRAQDPVDKLYRQRFEALPQSFDPSRQGTQ